MRTFDGADSSPALDRGKHDKEGRRLALMEAAVRVFAEHGYDAATTREIAERAGCSEGLIHRYFGGKHGLMLETLRECVAAITDEVAPELPVADLETEIRRLLTFPLEWMWRRREFMRVAVSRAIFDSEVGALMGDQVEHSRVSRIAERLTALQERGLIRGDVDVRVIAQSISSLGFALGFMAQAVFGRDRRQVERTAMETASVIARGIAP